MKRCTKLGTRQQFVGRAIMQLASSGRTAQPERRGAGKVGERTGKPMEEIEENNRHFPLQVPLR